MENQNEPFNRPCAALVCYQFGCKMPQLKFLRKWMGNQVEVLGVAFPDDALFHLFQGSQIKITSHLSSVQDKLKKVKTTRSSAIPLSDIEYQFYVKDGRLTYNGEELHPGKLQIST